MPLKMVHANLVEMRADAIVNAANTSLTRGGGVCGAIFEAAGAAAMQEACDAIGGCETGKAVITPGFRLPARFVIHTPGPVWAGGSHGEAELLAACYRNALTLAQQRGLNSIAFPLISAGIYGYPADQALHVAVRTIGDYLLTHDEIEVFLVRYGQAPTPPDGPMSRDIWKYLSQRIDKPRTSVPPVTPQNEDAARRDILNYLSQNTQANRTEAMDEPTPRGLAAEHAEPSKTPGASAMKTEAPLASGQPSGKDNFAAPGMPENAEENTLPYPEDTAECKIQQTEDMEDREILYPEDVAVYETPYPKDAAESSHSQPEESPVFASTTGTRSPLEPPEGRPVLSILDPLLRKWLLEADEQPSLPQKAKPAKVHKPPSSKCAYPKSKRKREGLRARWWRWWASVFQLYTEAAEDEPEADLFSDDWLAENETWAYDVSDEPDEQQRQDVFTQISEPMTESLPMNAPEARKESEPPPVRKMTLLERIDSFVPMKMHSLEDDQGVPSSDKTDSQPDDGFGTRLAPDARPQPHPPTNHWLGDTGDETRHFMPPEEPMEDSDWLEWVKSSLAGNHNAQERYSRPERPVVSAPTDALTESFTTPKPLPTRPGYPIPLAPSPHEDIFGQQGWQSSEPMLTRREEQARANEARRITADLSAAQQASTDAMRRNIQRLSLEGVLQEKQYTFSEAVLRRIDDMNLKDPIVYKRANLDRKLFSKLRNGRTYTPSRRTALSLCVALELTLNEAYDLLSRAGYTLSIASDADLIVAYFIEHEWYDIYDLNEALFTFNQHCLGV